VVTAPGVVFQGPLSVADPSATAALRAVFDRHGFSGTAAADAVGRPLPIGKAHLREDLPLYLRRVEAPTPINTLVKLFLLDRSVDEARARQAFAPLDLETVREIGLVEDGPRGIRARLRLSVHDGLLLAHDAYDGEQQTLRPDHVLDVNPTTISLSNLTIRRKVKRALEIGTGCGALALRASRHADHVIGTDTNERALNLAAFNAAINGITNVEWRLGSLFEPVAGERFDLMFSNPPYVISPDSQFIFRDGGRQGDALCEEVIRGAPEYLNDGGFATFLINWAIYHGEEWATPLVRWVDGNRCDSWLMLSITQDPTTYAAIWNRSRDREAYSSGLDRWLRYFEALNISLVGLGAVVLRRRDAGPVWIHADHLADNITAPAGAHIERLFAAQDRLSALPGDGALLDSAFAAAPDHELQERLKIEDGGYLIKEANVRLLGGLPFHGSVDAYAIKLLARCDGRRSLREISAEIAGQAGVDTQAFARACAPIARQLIAMGFLV
jgi:hypothetical protein